MILFRRLLSRLLFNWLDSLLGVGFSRPLEKEGKPRKTSRSIFQLMLGVYNTDLWQLPTPLLTKSVSTELEQNFYSRCPPEKRSHAYRDEDDDQSRSGTRAPTPEEVNAKRPRPSIADEKKGDGDTDGRLSSEPDMEKSWPNNAPCVKSVKSKRKKNLKSKPPKQDSSLLMAIHTTFFWQWWISGILKLASGMSLSPCVPPRVLQPFWGRYSQDDYSAIEQAPAYLAHELLRVLQGGSGCCLGVRHRQASGHWVWYWNSLWSVRDARYGAMFHCYVS